MTTLSITRVGLNHEFTAVSFYRTRYVSRFGYARIFSTYIFASVESEGRNEAVDVGHLAYQNRKDRWPLVVTETSDIEGIIANGWLMLHIECNTAY
jgi:hypothetical protein